MNARGTRRPHSRRVRSKPIRRKSSAGKGCGKTAAVMLLALAGAAYAIARGVWWLVA